jgi:hypothetical protein
MNFENLYNNVLSEKKPKPMTGFDYYKSIRKATPPTGAAFKDKSKYSRKAKHKKDIHEGVETPYGQISSILSSHGIIAADQKEIFDIIGEIAKAAYNEGCNASENNPFK